MTIEGVGPLTAACLIAELRDPAHLDSPGAIASYVGVIPRIRQSGKKRFTKGPAMLCVAKYKSGGGRGLKEAIAVFSPAV